MSDELQRIEEEWASAVAESDVEAAREILAEDFVLTSSGGKASWRISTRLT